MSEKNAEMKTETAMIVLTKIPATVAVVLHGTLVGTKFTVTSVEMDSGSVELHTDLHGPVVEAMQLDGLTAYADDGEVPVAVVAMTDGTEMGPYLTAGEKRAALAAHLEIAAAACAAAMRRSEGAAHSDAEGIMRLLKEVGITKVYVQYCGSGDSGQSEDVTVEDDAQVPLLALKRRVTQKHGFWNDVTSEWDSGVREVDETIEQMLLYFCDEVVSNYHSGYENNDGGEGTLTIDTEAWTMGLTHSDFYTERDSSHHEIIPAPTLKTLGLEEDDDAPSDS